jgi:hypothetical protein
MVADETWLDGDSACDKRRLRFFYTPEAFEKPCPAVTSSAL